MTAIEKRTLKFTTRILITIAVLASVIVSVPTAANAISVPSTANPAWPNKCGLKIGLVIDRSQSISSSEGNQMKSAAKGFVDALTGTPSQLAVASFGNTATQNLALTSVTSAGGATTVKNSIDGLSIGGTNLSTNWEAAFYSQNSLSVDVVVILTDGNPTRRNLDGSGGNGFSDPGDLNVDAGITRANALKSQGKRIVAVGIGNDLDINNLKAVSGPTNNDDYFTSSFSTLNSKLAELAVKICGGTVTVQKQVKNANGTYTETNGWDYSATNAVSSPKTTAGSGTAEFKYDNTPKSTTITETLKPGYLIESVVCTKNGQTIASSSTVSVTLTVGVNDIISCIFKNKPNTATLTINKTATGGNATFPFTSTVPGKANFNITTSGGSGTTGAFSIPAGTSYEVNEVVPAGWSLTGLSCTGTTATITGSKATFTAAIDSNVVCNYSNSRDTANLTIIKNVTAAGGVTNGSFDFTSTVPSHSSFNLTTVGGTKSTTFSSVPTGTYDITESVPAGWSLNGLNCSGTTPTISNPKVTVTLAKNANVTCTFTNARQTANLKVVKNVTAAGGVTDGTFNFLSNTVLGNFGLTTTGGTKSTSTVAIPTGTYSIAEIVPAGWSLATPSCTGATTQVQSPQVSITATAGANIVCTFTNTRQTANLTIVKNVTTAGGISDGSFNFTTDTLYGNFILNTVGGTAQTSTIAIPTGVYSLAEVVPAGWSLANPSCSGTSVVVTNPQVSITATAGANIVCTFTNTRKVGTLTLVKKSVGGNDSFDFETDTPLGNPTLTTVDGTKSTDAVEIPTGVYSISESALQGWSLTDVSCSNSEYEVDGSTITFGVTEGYDVVCTFENTRDTANLTIVKNVEAAGGVTDGTFDFTSNTVLGDFSLTTVNGTKSTSTVTIPTGNYEIVEDIDAGWSLVNLSCTTENYFSEGTYVSISPEKGEDIVCTFTNTRDTGTLTVVKNVTAAGGVTDGSFDFTSNTSLGDFNLTTVGGTKSTDVVVVPTGNYSIAEFVPAGWNLTSAVCVSNNQQEEINFDALFALDDVNSVNATVSSGDDVVCTFTNTRQTATLKVVENAIGGNDTFGFTSDTLLGAFDLTTVGGTAQTSTIEIPTGEYGIGQANPVGWTLSGLSCEGTTSVVANPNVSIAVAAGEEVVCTFTNTKDPEVLGTVVTRPDTQVKGITTSRLAVTGVQTRLAVTFAFLLIATGAVIFGFSRKRKGLI